MPEPVIVNPSLLQRLDVHAVGNPRSITRWIWFSGLIGAVALVRLLLAAAAGSWGLAAIITGTLLLCGLLWFVSRRAQRRVPITKHWLDGLSDT